MVSNLQFFSGAIYDSRICRLGQSQPSFINPTANLKFLVIDNIFMLGKTLESGIRIIAGGNSMVSAGPDHKPGRIEGGSK
jgi:hypothetical protein